MINIDISAVNDDPQNVGTLPTDLSFTEDVLGVLNLHHTSRADAFSEYIDAMVPSEAYTLVERDEDAVLVIIASDPAIGPDLAAAFS